MLSVEKQHSENPV